MFSSQQHCPSSTVCLSQFAIWDDKKGKNKTPTKQDKSSVFFFGDDTTLSLWEGCVLSSELNRDARVMALCNLGTLQPSQVTTAVNLLTRQIHM